MIAKTVLASLLIMAALTGTQIDMSQDDVPSILVGGVSLPVFVFVIVKAMEYVGLLKNGDHKRFANVITSLIGGAIWLTVQFAPQYSPIAATVVIALVGSLGSALLYTAVEKASTNKAIGASLVGSDEYINNLQQQTTASASKPGGDVLVD